MTQRVQRFDRASLPAGKAERLDSGAIRAPARLTRTGVFTYLQADGKVIRELRLPEEVFSPESVRSFELVPLTNNHPSVGNGAVTADNARSLAVGSVAGVQKDPTAPNFLTAMISAWDGEAVRQIEAGKMELSCGYFCDREPAPAGATYKDPITGDATPYDFTQRNIRGNHVAIVQAGRAGPEARIILDGADPGAAVEVESTRDQVSLTQSSPSGQPQEAKSMKTIRIDGVSFEVSDQVAEAMAKAEAQAADQIKALKADADQAKGQVAALTGQVSKLTADLAAAMDPSAVQAKVAERMEIVKIAEAHGLKADGLDMDGVKRAVVAKLDPAIKLDGQSADFVAGLFTVLTNKVQSVGAAIANSTQTIQRADSHTNKNSAQNYRDQFFAQK